MNEVHRVIWLAALSGFGIGCSLHRPSSPGVAVTAATILLTALFLARISC